MAIQNFLRLTSVQDDNVITLTKVGSPTAVSLEYRTDLEQEWQSYVIGTQLTLLNGSWVEFRNTTGTFSTGTSNYYKFTMTGRTQASGNVNSLLDWTKDKPVLKSYCYYCMFSGCASLTTAPELPSTTLASNCYRGMFNICTSLTTAPELPAKTVTNYCYYQMFYGCTSLTTAPELPAKTMTNYCYKGMFQKCSSLTQAPELPATTLASYCYNDMFFDCTSLTTAPELPATTLADNCYPGMFQNCTSLTKAPELPAMILKTTCYQGMFQNCTSLTKAPDLPATTLANSCYYYMFYGCSGINSLVFGASTVPTSGQRGNWLNGVSQTGTFYYTDENLNVSEFPRDGSGIPSGWTIQYLAPKPPLVFSINGRNVSSLTLNGKKISKLS